MGHGRDTLCSMIFDDEDMPKGLDFKFGAKLDVKLDDLSIDELHERVEALRAEIARTEGEIARKKASVAAAEAFFKN